MTGPRDPRRRAAGGWRAPTTAPAAAGIAPRLLTWTVSTRDPWRVLTLLAAAGLVMAVAMAIAGLPPADLHGPIHHLGIMDPTCGGTRSVRLAALGQWSASWQFNPLGVPLVSGAILLLVRAGIGALSGHWVSVHIGWTRPRGRAAIALAVILLVALEINQQAHAALLLTRR